MPDAIAGDDGASPFTAVLAVDKYSRRRSICDRKHFHDVLIHRAARTSHRHGGGDYAIGPGLGLLRYPDIVCHSQIDNRFDANAFETLETKSVGLGTTIETVIYPVEIGNSVGRRERASRGRAADDDRKQREF